MAFDFDLVVAEVVEVPGGLRSAARGDSAANITIGKERGAGRKFSRHRG
jgi:hypothetical protein